MQYNNLNGISLKTSLICIGTIMFVGQTNEVDSFKIMDYAYEHGIHKLL